MENHFYDKNDNAYQEMEELMKQLGDLNKKDYTTLIKKPMEEEEFREVEELIIKDMADYLYNNNNIAELLEARDEVMEFRSYQKGAIEYLNEKIDSKMKTLKKWQEVPRITNNN